VEELARLVWYFFTADLLIFVSSSGGFYSKQSPFLFSFNDSSEATALHSISSECIFRMLP